MLGCLQSKSVPLHGLENHSGTANENLTQATGSPPPLFSHINDYTKRKSLPPKGFTGGHPSFVRETTESENDCKAQGSARNAHTPKT